MNSLFTFSTLQSPRTALIAALTLSAVLFNSSILFAQIASGPMVGHVDMREARVWVQLNKESDVSMKYRDVENSRVFQSATVRAVQQSGFAVTLIADSVEPGRTYAYDIHINNRPLTPVNTQRFKTQPVWKHRADMYPSRLIAFGSCFYVNEPGYERFNREGAEQGYGSNYEIVESINKMKPDAMLWLGDNVYLREPDWNSRSGILKRYSHTRALPQLQPLLASTPNYAIWDDHDYGPNDGDRSFVLKQDALDIFKTFWPNPSYGVDDKPGTTSSFEMIDVQFLLLDDRYYRQPNERTDKPPTILGDHQVEWLIDALCSSTATFKIVCVGSQFLTSNVKSESFARAPVERQRIIDAITANKINGVLFLSGDIHASEFSKLDRPGAYPLYELTCSPLTAGVSTKLAEYENTNRVDGSVFAENNFGSIMVNGPKGDRMLTLRIYNVKGGAEWTRIIREAELRIKN
ncbi:MAG: alkaline phosphatase family protein [Ignavibacteria bacterium]|nr:alkaline phosphatase family protein [Ignavibacteria bacterium]